MKCGRLESLQPAQTRTHHSFTAPTSFPPSGLSRSKHLATAAYLILHSTRLLQSDNETLPIGDSSLNSSYTFQETSQISCSSTSSRPKALVLHVHARIEIACLVFSLYLHLRYLGAVGSAFNLRYIMEPTVLVWKRVDAILKFSEIKMILILINKFNKYNLHTSLTNPYPLFRL